MINIGRTRIISKDDGASLDFCIVAGEKPLLVSFFDRSLVTIKAIGAGFNTRRVSFRLTGAGCGAESFYTEDSYDFYCSRIEGYDPFYCGLVVNKELHEKNLITTRGRETEDFYSYLMRNYDLPLMKEWSGVLWKWARSSVCQEQNGVLYTANPEKDRIVPLPDGRKISLRDLEVYHIELTPEVLENAVSTLLKTDAVKITGIPQKPLEFDGMDDYFKRYGGRIVQNLQSQMNPLTGYIGEVDGFTLKHKKLYPQQAAMVNGCTAMLTGVGNKKERRKNHSRYAILNEGMGTGKTIQGASICEAIAVASALRSGRDLKSVYMDRDSVKYRNIVMCPSHLVEKWAEEIRNEIPYATAVILDSFEDIIKLWKRGAGRTEKEFYIISKDFAKLSYSEKPVPTKMAQRKLKFRKCNDCGREVQGALCSCGSSSWSILPTESDVIGLLCPNCNNVLVPCSGRTSDEEGEPVVLGPQDFASKKNINSNCRYCGEPLWQPHVRNIGCSEKGKWRKISHFANKAKKGKKTAWIHMDYLEEYLLANSIKEGEYTFVKGEGVRRVDPASFIKKHMKNFFDVAIFDEVHTLKGGDTAQGHAMHALVKASKRQLALTGTIAGGCAHHLFYMLFRLDPARMRKEGFSWGSVNKFSEVYGSTETVYEAVQTYTGEYKVNSRGKKLTEPKVTPGISPLVFTKFLLDRAVMLDITDMSSHLPALRENVVLVNAEEEEEKSILQEYNRVIRFLKDTARSGHGMTVLSTMLQFSLSYLDKPYGVEPILDPLTGQVLAKVPSFDKFSGAGNRKLLAKERKLVELVKAELSEGRNCFIYAEYTNSPQTCVTDILRNILMHHVGLKENEVLVLDSTSVKASKREAWIHEKAEAGMRVCIVNPRCVETGLDFCFQSNGVTYNYPTIIFYQLGYSLFIIWQASRRHYRLNQKEECRTHYMAYGGTVQEVVISLIAEKMATTAAIQGRFSADGLTAMAQGVDTRVRLAQALSNMDTETGKELQGMFDAINDISDISDEIGYTPMLLLHELIGADAAVECTVEIKEISDDIPSVFGLFGEEDSTGVKANVVSTGPAEKPVHQGESTPVSGTGQECGNEMSIFSLMELLFDDDDNDKNVSEVKVVRVTEKKVSGRKILEGQMLLF